MTSPSPCCSCSELKDRSFQRPWRTIPTQASTSATRQCQPVSSSYVCRRLSYSQMLRCSCWFVLLPSSGLSVCGVLTFCNGRTCRHLFLFLDVNMPRWFVLLPSSSFDACVLTFCDERAQKIIVVVIVFLSVLHVVFVFVCCAIQF